MRLSSQPDDENVFLRKAADFPLPRPLRPPPLSAKIDVGFLACLPALRLGMGKQFSFL
jgi:hypothetical protein